jgi:IMP dehydrogenase
MSARDTEIGLNRFARRGYDLDEVSIVPSRRTRDMDDVSTAWQIDAFRFDIPLITSPSDAVVSPATAVAVGLAGGLGVLNAEGLWTRYDDPAPIYRQLREAAGADAPPIALLQQVYAEPVKPDLITARIKEMRDAGVTTAVRISPQHTLQYAPAVLAAGVDLLVIQGTIVSAEHVTTSGEALNLKDFIADLDVPVIVGGAANYQTALHLMRTGAAGVIVRRRRHGDPRPAGQRDRRRCRRPPRLPRRDRRPLRARDRQRPDRDQRCHRPCPGLRSGRRPAG